MFKRSASKSATNESTPVEVPPVKPAPVLEGRKDLSLLCQPTQALKPYYLEMPIKIEPRSQDDTLERKESQSCAEQFQCSQNESRKIMKEFIQTMNTTKEDVFILQSQLKAFHMLDQIMTPDDNNQNLSESKNEGRGPLGMMRSERLVALPFPRGQIDPVKKLLLGLINDYQAYTQSLKIATNFHTLQKKDFMTKMFGNILGVISRENKKMENGLLLEFKNAGFASGEKHEATSTGSIICEQESPIYPCKALFKSTPENKRIRKASEGAMQHELYYED